MRPDLSMRYHRYQGKPYWVVKEPIGLKYFRFQEEEFSILQMLDGTVSFQDIKDRFEKDFAPQKITLNDLQHFIGMLHRSGLLITGAEGQGRQLKQRKDEQFRKELLGKFSNVLAIRFKGIDPDKILNFLAPFTNWFFTKWAVMGVAAIGIGALLLLGTNFSVFRSRLPAFHEFFGPENWFWLGMTLGITKVIHEFGHGLSCKRFGGECHEMGVMFLVLTPCLYCNVSDSWLLPSKWHRAAIGAAGMYVELTMASIAVFLWWFSDQASTINQISLSVMFICSVSTVLFNGNPLLRFDGYYIMADVVEIPNLRQKSSKIMQRFMAEYGLGLEQQEDPFLPQRNRGFFAFYTIAAVMYRWVVVFSILMFLNQVLEPYGLQVVGRVIAAAGLFGLVIQPLWQLGKFLHVPGRMHQVKKKNVMITAAILGLILAAFCYVPLPYSVKCAVQLQNNDADTVFAAADGILAEVNVKQGDSVELGQQIARMRNLDLDLRMEQINASIAQLTETRKALDRDPQAARERAEIDAQIEGQERQLAILQPEVDRLSCKATKAGVIVPPPFKKAQPGFDNQLQPWSGSLLDPKNIGATVTKSDVVCFIAPDKEFEAILAIDQSEIRFIQPDQDVKIKMEAFAGDIFETKILEDKDISREPMHVVPQSLTTQAGGIIPTQPDPTGVHRPLSATYQVIVSLKNENNLLDRGMRGRAKIGAAPQSLGTRVYRYLAKTFHFDL